MEACGFVRVRGSHASHPAISGRIRWPGMWVAQHRDMRWCGQL